MYITKKNLLRKNNNFDLLRLFAALLVFLTHSFAIRGMGGKEWVMQLSGNRHQMSDYGLIIFFSMSGFLVCRSLVTVKSTKEFLRNRFLRLWPAFAVCIVLTVLVIGVIFTSLPVEKYLLHQQTLEYFFRNITLLSSTMFLPEVFGNNGVNTSIWTIPIEARLYLLLLLLFLATKLRFKQWLLICLAAAWILLIFIPGGTLNALLKVHNAKAVNLGIYFVMGACFYLYKEKIPLTFYIWLALLAYCLLVIFLFPAYLKKLQHPFMVYTVLWMAVRWPKIPFIKADLSYAFYLYAYPFQQMVNLTIGSSINFAEYVLITGACTGLVAWFSWHFIEKKALSLKHGRHRRSAAQLDLIKEIENEAGPDKQGG